MANILQSQQLTGDLLGRIRGRIKDDDGLPAGEVLALAKANQLLAPYDPSIEPLISY